MDVNQLFGLASDVLGCVVSGFAAADVVLPARQFTHYGDAAISPGCEQVVVSFVDPGLAPNTPGQQPRIPVRCAIPRSVTLDVWISRCVPKINDDGAQPSAVEMVASAQIGLRDAWTLTNVLVDASIGNCFGDSCERHALLGVIPVGPNGGMASIKATLQLQLTPTR